MLVNKKKKYCPPSLGNSHRDTFGKASLTGWEGQGELNCMVLLLLTANPDSSHKTDHFLPGWYKIKARVMMM